MMRSLIILSSVFFALSIYDVYQMRAFVTQGADHSARTRIEQLLGITQNAAQPVSSRSELLQGSLLLLEAEGMDKRHRQASALLLSRIWTRQLAFMTGMVLAFIGAVFILGKLSEARTDVNFGAEHWKGAISSSSPGLILAFFGTVLIAISLIVQPRIDVEDRPVYFTTMGLLPNPSAAAPKPERVATDPGAIDPGLGETPPGKEQR